MGKFFMSLGNYVDVVSFEPKVFSGSDPYVFVQVSYNYVATTYFFNASG
ncbi:MAG: hypothetical protein ABI462_08735 [Ignavibacteria bacterium]